MSSRGLMFRFCAGVAAAAAVTVLFGSTASASVGMSGGSASSSSVFDGCYNEIANFFAGLDRIDPQIRKYHQFTGDSGNPKQVIDYAKSLVPLTSGDAQAALRDEITELYRQCHL